ncbi:hypothetical protein LINPERPRIM_LOCUS7126 [Linum perenne]
MLSQSRFRKHLIWFLSVSATLVLYLLYYFSFIYSTATSSVHHRCISPEEHYDIIRNISSSNSHHLHNKIIHANVSSNATAISPIPPPQIQTQTPPSNETLSIGHRTELKHLVFGVAASADLWETRKEYVKVWWRPRYMRAIVWMDRPVNSPSQNVGSSSESHIQNIYFSYNMAYGGGGFAISYPLALELAKVQDKCIQRYPGLYGSDDRVHACMAELGVPLTKEPGFHQYDVYGDLLGLLAAHPVSPLASLHHLDIVEPIFPGKSRVEALNQLFQSVRIDSASVIQQSICYDKDRYWSISVSWGYAVQVWRGVISPRELEIPTRTFMNWYRREDYTAYSFNTRPVTKHPCLKPFVFYMSTTKLDRAKNKTLGVYYRHKAPSPYCRWKMASPEKINSIVVMKRPDHQRWKKSPRRDCCRVVPTNRTDSMFIWVGTCRTGEMSELDRK